MMGTAGAAETAGAGSGSVGVAALSRGAALTRVKVSEPHILHRNYQRMMEKGMGYPS